MPSCGGSTDHSRSHEHVEQPARGGAVDHEVLLDDLRPHSRSAVGQFRAIGFADGERAVLRVVCRGGDESGFRKLGRIRPSLGGAFAGAEGFEMLIETGFGGAIDRMVRGLDAPMVRVRVRAGMEIGANLHAGGRATAGPAGAGRPAAPIMRLDPPAQPDLLPRGNMARSRDAPGAGMGNAA